MSVELKAIREDDTPELLPLIAEFNTAEGIETSQRRIALAFKKLLADPALGRAWFIYSNDIRVGYLVLTFGFDMEYGGRDAWITDFYVRPDFEGRGVGTEALTLLEEKALRLEICALHLMVYDGNARARNVYGKRGFKRNPRIALIKILAEE